MDVLEDQFLTVQHRLGAVLPRRDVGEVLVVPARRASLPPGIESLVDDVS
ncbi:hypothetical protein AB0F15_34445 [Amycolatopsis sp. NPDC026612]